MRSNLLMAALAAVVALGLLAGCGGGGSTAPPVHPAGTGSITGTVVFFDHPAAPVTGVQIELDGVVVTSTLNDAFTMNATPGSHTVTVVPPDTFALPQASLVVIVTEDATYTIPSPFVLFPEGEQPPGTP
jgi:hypothetical protein